MYSFMQISMPKYNNIWTIDYCLEYDNFSDKIKNKKQNINILWEYLNAYVAL